MEPISRFSHAYSQAPWRLQRQWVSVFLLVVLGFAIIATLYLMVTSQAAILGREIQDLRAEIMETEHANADLQTKLASLTSTTEMERRAYALGYRPVKTDELEYLVVPGYIAPEGVTLAAAPEFKASGPGTPPEYTQSLLDWFDEQLQIPQRGLR